MKISTFALASLLICTGVVAQESATTPKLKAVAISEKYVVELTMRDKEQTIDDLSIVVAAPQFNTTYPDSKLNVFTFGGTLSAQEDGTIFVTYTLGGSVMVSPPPSLNYKAISTQASVRLKLGEPIEILKNGAQIWTLRIALLSAEAKSK